MQFAGPTHCGGVGTAFFSLAETLAAHGHDVTVLLACDELDRSSPTEWQHRLRAAGMKFVHLPRKLHRGSRFAWRAEASFNCYQWLQRRDFDVIHFHEWLGLGYYPVLAKRQGLAFRSTVLCVGTHGPEQWALQGNGAVPSEIGQLETHAMERESVRLADVVVSPSQHLLHWLKQEGWSLPERTYVHPNVLWSKAVAGPRPGDGKTTVTEVVFFGRLEHRKGLYLFCDGVERLPRTRRPQLRVTFLGRKQWLRDRQEWSDEFLRRRTRDWPYTVSILTDKNHEEALDYLRTPGRLAVVASRRENSPYTVLECLGAGICLICTDVGGVRELIHEDDCARVSFKEDELTAKLCQVLDQGAAPARPALDLDLVKERWVRWHETGLAGSREFRFKPRKAYANARGRSFDVCVLADTFAEWDRWVAECAAIAERAERLFVVPTANGEAGRERRRSAGREPATVASSVSEAVRASDSEFLLIANATTYVDPRFVERGIRILATTGASTVTSVAYDRHAGAKTYRPGSPLFFPIATGTCVAAFRPVLGNHAIMIRRRDCARAADRLEDMRRMSIRELSIEWTLAGLALEVMPEPWLGTILEANDPPSDPARSGQCLPSSPVPR